MTTDTETLAHNINIGYKIHLKPTDAITTSRRLFHGRLGGDLTELRDEPMFFYAEGHLSSEFAEHIFINGDDTYNLAGSAENDEDYTSSYLSQAPVVLQATVFIDNPAILDMELLAEVAAEVGTDPSDIAQFIADFEDSCPEPRNKVFNWAKQHGYDGAVIVNDMTPEIAGGDWCFRTSYVAFHPQRQVSFIHSSR